MPQTNFTPQEPTEALYAFLDGELEVSEEQRLFDELASSSELRTEMKDILSIRAAVHRDLIAAPSSLETNLLSTVGLGSAVVTGAGTAAISGVTRSTNILLNRLFSGIIGIAAGLIAAWFLFEMQRTPPTNGVAGYSGQQANQQQPQPAAARVDTVYSTRVITRVVPAQSINVSKQVEAQTPISQMSAVIEEPSAADLPHETRITELPQTRTPRLDRYDVSSSITESVRRPLPLSTTSYLPMVAVRIRSLASGLSQTEPVPQSVRDALVPNTAFSLLFPLAEHQQLGVEMGQESFVQNFTGYEENRPIRINQTPVLFWIGGTYIVSPFEFSFLPGLSPFAEATLGMVFKQGPIGRGTIGLSYQPVGPLRMTFGIDGSALLYQFQGNSFTSTKWGVSYGLSVDIGSIR